MTNDIVSAHPQNSFNYSIVPISILLLIILLLLLPFIISAIRNKARLEQFFQDGNNYFSATRLVFILWSTGVLIVWSINSIATKSLLKIDYSIVGILMSFMTGKVVQFFFEMKDSSTKTSNEAEPESSEVQKSDSSK